MMLKPMSERQNTPAVLLSPHDNIHVKLLTSVVVKMTTLVAYAFMHTLKLNNIKSKLITLILEDSVVNDDV